MKFYVLPRVQVGVFFNITWAYHTWDYNAAFERWQGVQPQQHDTELSKLLQVRPR